METTKKSNSVAHGHGATAHGHGHGAPANHDHGNLNHETSDLDPRPIIRVGIILLVFVLFSYALMAGLFFIGSNGSNVSNTVPTAEAVAPNITAARLQAQPRVEEDAVIVTETEHLESYGWVNERTGTVHIPIEQAMELIVERGVNTTPAEGSSGQQP